MNGGRTKFFKGKLYRIIQLDGSISERVYHVNEDCVANRKSLIELEDDRGGRVNVHSRRVLPAEVGEKAPVIISNGAYVALCPKCGTVHDVAGVDTITCCGEKFEFYYCGGSEMAKVQQQYKPDIDELKKLDGCELWQKKSEFNHPHIEVFSYALLLDDGENSRCYRFNTYNGTTGKSGKRLLIDEFMKNEQPDGGTVWRPVKDVEKERTKLTNKGYKLLK